MARILVIDDNADLLQMIRMLLEQRGGHEAILSAEGEDALVKAFANPPDLAIVDVMMPGITGYEVCRRLRKDPSTANMPIIILTARGQSVDRDAALEAGADLYIAKPVTMSELLEQVNELLAKKPMRRPTAKKTTLAMLSLRGGIGVTTLAVNLSLVLSHRAPGRSCLFDLCPSSGHAALHLGLRPEPNWASLGQSGAAGETAVRGALLTHATQLRLLAAPFVPVVGGGLSRQATQTILSVLWQDFDLVVVDLPSVLTDGAMAVLEAADAIGVVVVGDQPGIQTTLGTLQALKPLAAKVRLILNQPLPGATVPIDALQRVLKYPFVGLIPFDSLQAQALGRGQPLALVAANAPLVQGVAQLATKLELV